MTLRDEAPSLAVNPSSSKSSLLDVAMENNEPSPRSPMDLNKATAAVQGELLPTKNDGDQQSEIKAVEQMLTVDARPQGLVGVVQEYLSLVLLVVMLVTSYFALAIMARIVFCILTGQVRETVYCTFYDQSTDPT